MTDLELEKLANLLAKKMMPKVEKTIEGLIKEKFNSDEVLLTQTELADLLRIHPSNLHGKADIYPHVLVGDRKRFLKSKVIASLIQKQA